MKRIEFGGRFPADVVVFRIGESHGAVFGSRPVDHADVFVGVGDAVDIEKARCDESAGARLSGGRSIADEFDIEARFFAGFTKSGLLRILGEFDMAAEREPFVELAMVHEEDLAILNDEDRDGEIDFFMDVRHGGRTVG